MKFFWVLLTILELWYNILIQECFYFMDQQFVQKAWYKKGWGIGLLVFLFVIVIMALIFAGFFVYYAVQIKYGDVSKLNKQFNPNAETVEVDELNLGKPITDWQKYIRSHNPTTGENNARVTIIEFVDFECPICRGTYPTFKALTEKYAPVLKVVFKNLPFESTHPDAKVAALAAKCAQEQKVFWQYQELLLTGSKFDIDGLLTEATKLNLNLDMFNLCLSDQKFLKEVGDDLMDAASLNLKGTPSYLVNGYLISGAPDEKMWDRIMVKMLQSN